MESQLTIRLPKQLATGLEKFAKRLGLKRADLVRMALQQLLGDSKKEGPGGSVYERVASLIGSVETGLTDLGENHREYFLKRLKEKRA